jgi:hypothetical protein
MRIADFGMRNQSNIYNQIFRNLHSEFRISEDDRFFDDLNDLFWFIGQLKDFQIRR